jgi:hypothetical protein
MKTFTPPAGTVAQIQTGLAELAAAADSKRAADAVLAEKVSLRDDVAATAESLAACDPNNAADISQLITARTRLPLFPRIIAAAEKDAAAAAAAEDKARDGLSKAIAAAFGEIASQIEADLAQSFAKLTDVDFGKWCASRAPAVTQCVALSRNVGLATSLGLSLPALAELAVKGKVPSFQPQQAPDAAMVMLSASPARCTGATGMGYNHDVAEAGPRFVTP